MKTIVLRSAIAVGMLVVSGYTMACQFNTDCDVGSKCVKPSGSLYGYCLGGMNPGNSYDRTPATDIMGGGGYTCSFNTDCDPGYRCAKSGLQGACVKR